MNAIRWTASAVLATAATITAQTPAASVTTRPAERARRDAAVLDALLESGLAARGVRPNPRLGDAAFARRAYLTVAGRTPTGAEVEAFVGSQEHDKRGALVDRLLDSPGYTSHRFNELADLLRIRTRLNRQISGEPYIHFVKQAIVDDVPYDAFVRTLLTAEGPAHAHGNGATGYHLRDLGMPHDNMSNTARVFLGTRLECAQCHNHPFDRWTQLDFYRMAAFSGGLRYRSDPREAPELRALRQSAEPLLREHGQAARQALRRLTLPLTFGVGGGGTGMERLPKDYQYDDARPRQAVAAAPLFGARVRLPVQQPQRGRRGDARRQRGQRPAEFRDVGSRAAYAAWLTAPDNPRFARVAANRMWQRVFGLGLIEPVDDLKDDSPAVYPELMLRLEGLLVELDFDLRQFQRVLLRMAAFERAAEPRPADGESAFAFAGPLLRRMSAEQLWDSLLTLVVPDLDGTLLPPSSERTEAVYARYEQLLALSPEQLEEEFELMIMRGNDPAKYRAELQRRRRAERMAQQLDRQREIRPLLQQLQRARRRGESQRVAALEAKLAELGYRGGDPRGTRAYRDLVRASDLPAPAPPDHLLRQLGQSDREQIDGGHREPNVPQVLTLLNGFVDERVLDERSVLMRRLARAPDAESKLRTAYLDVLGREPTPPEVELWRDDLAQAGGALHDLVWVLVNSHEFRFIR